MKTAYNETWLFNLKLTKEVKAWAKQDLVSPAQLDAIFQESPSAFYHPNLVIRILIFIASLIALGGITGLLVLFVSGASEKTLSVLAIFYGVCSLFLLEKVLLNKNHHYKSGVTEAVLYHSIGFIIGGTVILLENSFGFDRSLPTILLLCILLFSFSAFRYLDMISTLAALVTFSYLVFYELDKAGGLLQGMIPLAFILLFALFYFCIRYLKRRKSAHVWMDCLIIAESFALLMVYAAGNYLVVRELSVNLMHLNLQPGENIPLAFLFYFLTIGIPVAYLYFGIKNKDVILLRVSMVVLAFSVFTFKYYYSLGHPEITLTVSGLILLGISLALFRYLQKPRNGFTGENILSEKWANMNVEAFIISQTVGGNKVVESAPDSQAPEGGTFGGGGASGSF